MSLTLHIVPHTHWDREWYLPFQEYRIRLVHLMDRLLDILSTDGSYRHFMLDGQSILLEDYLEIRPERAEEISQFVRVGRLSIGPWYVLPDEFLVSSESLVRNLMMGDRVCHRFGDRMLVGYIPDPFGHISQMPQIMRGFGIETVAFRRGLAEEPAELWWAAPDGSRVLVSYLRDGYDNAARLPTAETADFVAAIRRARDSLAPHVVSENLLLLAGTDHQEAQPELPALIAEANDGRLDGDRLVHSSLSTYFEAVREAIEAVPKSITGPLHTVAGELRSPQRHHLLPDVLSARMWIKQRNDAVETLLTRWVEPFSAWAELLVAREAATTSGQHAHLTGHEPLRRVRQPSAFIWHAWRLLLANHPHDSICGCSVDQVHKEMTPRFDQAEQIGQQITTQSLTTIAEHVNTCPPDMGEEQSEAVQPLVVFNPSDGPRSDVVTIRLQLPSSPEALEVISPKGQVVPHQVAAEPVGTKRSLFHVEVTPEALATYLGFVEGGRILNHVIHRVDLKPADDEMEITLVVSAGGEPDHARLAAARSKVEALIASGTVSKFIVRAVVAKTRGLTFIAPDLPGYGYATFVVREAEEVGDPQKRSNPSVLESDLFLVEADPTDGTVTLTDKTSGVVYPGLNRFADGGDRGDEYNYCQPEEDITIVRPIAPPVMDVVEDGPARQTMEIAQTYRLPQSLKADRRGRSKETVDVTFLCRVSLYPGVRRVDFETTVDNRAKDHRLRVLFPVPASVQHAHTEAHFHVARRPVPPIPVGLDSSDWVEQPVRTVPQRGWADVSDGHVGLMLANRGLPEVEFIPEEDQSRTTMALTLLRCVGWLSRDDMHCRQGHAGPGLATPDAQCLGRYTFHYALIPHVGDWTQARSQAAAFRTPLRGVVAGVHPGPLQPVASLIQAEPSAFALTAIKQPEQRSGAGLLVRGVNMSDEPVEVRLRPWHGFDRSSRVNLNEEFLEPLLAEMDRTVSVTAQPWEIVTVKWREA
jgi:alpha-mannosidase